MSDRDKFLSIMEYDQRSLHKYIEKAWNMKKTYLYETNPGQNPLDKTPLAQKPIGHNPTGGNPTHINENKDKTPLNWSFISHTCNNCKQ